jgi:hypothetical protein
MAMESFAPRCKGRLRGLLEMASSRFAQLAMTPTFAVPNTFAKLG